MQYYPHDYHPQVGYPGPSRVPQAHPMDYPTDYRMDYPMDYPMVYPDQVSMLFSIFSSVTDHRYQAFPA
jgi:hypothetical protein